MTAPEIKFDRNFSLDNTGQHADRGARLRHLYYQSQTPQPMHFADYFGVMGKGDTLAIRATGLGVSDAASTDIRNSYGTRLEIVILTRV